RRRSRPTSAARRQPVSSAARNRARNGTNAEPTNQRGKAATSEQRGKEPNERGADQPARQDRTERAAQQRTGRGSRGAAPGAADLALLAAVLVAGSVERHAVYTWYGVLILIGCVGLLFGAVLAGAGRSVPRPWSVAVAALAAAWFQLVKPPW